MRKSRPLPLGVVVRACDARWGAGVGLRRGIDVFIANFVVGGGCALRVTGAHQVGDGLRRGRELGANRSARGGRRADGTMPA